MKNILPIILLFISGLLFSQQLELPEITSPNSIVIRENYILQYNEKFEQADWVAYNLTRDEVMGSTTRNDSFKIDKDVITGSATLEDYKGSGYDRGHLSPSADNKMSKESMSDSFYMSNMSPQNPSFNRGIWAKLESYVRTWAYENDSIYVVTGPVLTKDSYTTIGFNAVAIPEYYYKVILDYSGPEIKAIGFILPNKKGDSPLESYAVTVDRVEEFTGINFYPELPDIDETSLESTLDIGKWTFKNFTAPKVVKKAEMTSDIFWINSSSMTRHNSTCKYYDNTKNGYFTSDSNEGAPCSICGG